MIWKNTLWDEMDVIMVDQSDNPIPEGAEIDLDAIGREDEDDER